jgi:putative chitobiose transport system permease protein
VSTVSREAALTGRRERSLGVRLAPVLRRSWPAYLLLLPFLLHFLFVVAYPFFYSIYLSFFDAGLGQEQTFIGLQNYVQLLHDADFRQALVNTFDYTVIVVLAEATIPLALALMLNEPLRGRTLLRIAIFLPVITAYVVVALIWAILFNDQGVVNGGLQALHLPAQPFLADGRQAMAIVMAVGVWKDLGYYMIIYLAALQAVPHELVEAAAIDGASRWRSIWHVTIPNLRPVTYFVASIATINAMQLFTQAYIMTNGGPLNATMSIVLLLYREAFVKLQLGYGSAIGTVLLVLLVALSLLNKKISDWMSR